MAAILKKLPGPYPLTAQQLRFQEALERCGIRKGISRQELIEKMQKCIPEYYSRTGGVNMPEPAKEQQIKVFTASHCVPCQDFKKLVEEGRVEVDAPPGSVLNILDVESEEGFAELVKIGSLDQVPSAALNGQACRIEVDTERDVVVIRCPKNESPPAVEEKKE